MLRLYTKSSLPDETATLDKVLLWLYIPDFRKGGRMGNITFIPNQGKSNSSNVSDYYWIQEDKCAGFSVPSNCPWRYEEMDLITYTPIECTLG